MVNYAQEDLTIKVPINETARTQAQKFADGQPSPEKASQVYRNTLAVLAVREYLQWLEIATDLQECDSWNAATRTCGDVADLMITGLGRIECRPVLNLETTLLPPEVWHNRIGYIFMQLQEDEREATLLGFLPTFDPEEPLEEVSLAEIQSIDALIDYLHRLELGQQVLNESSPEAEQVRQLSDDSYTRLIIIAQLERIYRTERPTKWRVKGEKVLSGRVLEGAGVRETPILSDRIQLQDVAQRLLERLAEVWQSAGEGL